MYGEVTSINHQAYCSGHLIHSTTVCGFVNSVKLLNALDSSFSPKIGKTLQRSDFNRRGIPMLNQSPCIFSLGYFLKHFVANLYVLHLSLQS